VLQEGQPGFELMARLQQRLRGYQSALQEVQRGGAPPSAQQVQQQQLAEALAEAARQQQGSDELKVGGVLLSRALTS
jgi:hypothetical protein